MKYLNILLVLGIILMLSLSMIRLHYNAQVINVQNIAVPQSFLSTVSLPSSLAKSSIATFSSPPQISSAIVNSELTGSGVTNGDFWFDEKFISGTTTTLSNGIGQCNAENQITVGHLGDKCWYYNVLGTEQKVCIPWWYPGSSTSQNYPSVTGYLGFPATESGGLLTWGSQSCKATSFPDLESAIFPPLLSAKYALPQYCLPGTGSKIYSYGGPFNNYGLSSPGSYPNYFNWSTNGGTSYVEEYGYGTVSASDYYYAINTQFFEPDSSNPSNNALSGPSAIIIPSVSCGATFGNNYINLQLPLSDPNIANIVTLSGFTPSVGLAGNQNRGLGVTYVFGNVFWPPYENYIEVAPITNMAPTFDYNAPTLNFAKFPAGNNGDLQYINVSGFFPAFLPANFFSSGGSEPPNGGSTQVAEYESTESLTSTTIVDQVTWDPATWVGYLENPSNYLAASNSYTLPNLEAGYYPEASTGTAWTSSYLYFATDAVFPFCAWNTTSNAISTSCTFENPSTVNPVSYIRLWSTDPSSSLFGSGQQINTINDQPFAPAYSSNDNLNAFTDDELNSFCFYGEDFNTTTGVYTPPSYTNIIPPTSAENYTTAIGQCNAFFNNTNCFSNQYSSNINFNDGIFTSNIKCTSKGLVAGNVTDAWLTSLYVANDGGDFCGDFLGQKNMSNPEANSTLFLQAISTGCPTFNSNQSEVPLVITVKNVGTTTMYNPYLVVLYGDTNASQMFYTAPSTGAPNDYELFYNFVDAMQSNTNGVIEVRYNNALQTDMYYYMPNFPLNPVPIQQILAGGSSSYLAGPYNNSLLGMWMYPQKLSGAQNQLIRTSNTFLVQSSSGDTSLPIILPNGTATFTVDVPMGVFQQLVTGKYNVAAYFGDMMNVSWVESGGTFTEGSTAPVSFFGSSTYKVSPLVQSGMPNTLSDYNNELLDPVAAYPSPPWQYIVSYNFNLNQPPFTGITIDSDSLNISVNALNNVQSGLNVTLESGESTQVGAITFTSKLLTGSSVSCFATQDNIQDFSVFWNVQAVSPPNLQYAIQDFYSQNGQVDNVLVKRWTGLVFMPYADEVALNYDNLEINPTSTVSMQLQKPIINQSVLSAYSDEAFVYFGQGNEQQLFGNLSSLHSILGVQATLTTAAVPQALYGFDLETGSLIGSKSVIRIAGVRSIQNYSKFSINSDSKLAISLNVLNDGIPTSCSIFNLFTTNNQTLSIPASACVENEIATAKNLNTLTLQVNSNYGPFSVQAYNNSNLNLSNTGQGGTQLVSSNATQSASSGIFSLTLNLSQSLNNAGLALVFSILPQFQVLTNSNVYLYYLNDTPFTCNIVNNFAAVKSNGVYEVAAGEYYAPNGNLLCNLTGVSTGIRAVFFNATSKEYSGSGDIGFGTAVQNLGGTALFITDNGAPLNSQDVNLSLLSDTYPIHYGGGCSITNQVVYNGILNYSTPPNKFPCNIAAYQNYTINFTEPINSTTEQGEVQTILKSANFEYPAQFPVNGQILSMAPIAVTDSPDEVYNLSISLNNPASAFPISFSLDNPGNCNDIELLSNAPYPYAEIPYQVIPSQGTQCLYEAVINRKDTFSGTTYTIFAGTTAEAVPYSESWLNVSSTPYNSLITTDSYSTNLLANCKPSLGPCLSSFSLGNSGDLGNILVNNVSASQASIVQTINGPIVKCFKVSYSASQQVVWPETGFGGINYNSNQLYQITTPSQSIGSTYCFFNGASVIIDSVTSSGQALSFSIENNLISNFSYAVSSNGEAAYVPSSVDVGYSGTYSTVDIYKQVIAQHLAKENYTLNDSTVCTGDPYAPTGLLTGVTIPSYSGSGTFYCVFGLPQTYTSESTPSNDPTENFYTAPTGESIALYYKPGVYNLSVSGKNVTLYGDCGLTANITSSSQTNFNLGNGEELYVLTEPQVGVNLSSGGSWYNYNPSNAGENYIVTYSAPDPLDTFNSEGIIYSPSGGDLIQQCPTNSSVANYTVCTNIQNSNAVIPENGSYDQIEAIPNFALGNYNGSSAGTYGPANYIGGGCFVGTEGSKTYTCAPTDGSLDLSVSTNSTPFASGVTTGEAQASYTLNLYEDPSDPVSASTIGFNCAGWVANQTSGPNTLNASYTCSYGSNTKDCEATFTNNQPSPGSLSGSLVAECLIQTEEFCPVHGCPTFYSGMQISSLSISGVSQAEPTAQTGDLLCGNVTDPIEQNVQSGIGTWKPFATKQTTNSAAVAEVGGCEAGRDVLNISQPVIGNITVGNDFYGTYSCPSGYSGSIESCSSPQASRFSASLSSNPSCYTSQYPTFTTSLSEEEVGGANGDYGAVPLGCKATPTGYSNAEVSDQCISNHAGVSENYYSSYVLQYSNQSVAPMFALGLGLVNQTAVTNVSIPASNSKAIIKDQYMSALSVSQYEINNIFTQTYPSDLFLSDTPAVALFKSSVYPFDLMNILLLQNPYFKVYGIPALANGSVFDYALNLFTGGTSQNCLGNPDQGEYGIFTLGEGELCSGQTLPTNYPNGIYLSLGALNEGLHSVQFYSVSETGTTANPTVTLYDTVGSAYNVNAACPNGNSRVFTSTYSGTGAWRLNITSDEECNTINNVLYGYIVNCLYQTPGNTTYTVASQYYLGYNLPTIWNVSYTLLVSPKSYKIIPTQLYNVNTSSGTSHLSFYPPTLFIESGLPQSVLSSNGWTVTYGGKVFSSSTTTIAANINGTLLAEPLFIIQNVTTYIGGCGTTYIPVPANGRTSVGSTVNVDFTSVVNCQTTFELFNISAPDGGYIDQEYYGFLSPLNPRWGLSYDSLGGSNDTGDSITITTPPNVQGSFGYTGSMSPVLTTSGQFNVCNIVPADTETGTLVALNWNCSTSFYPFAPFFFGAISGLPSGQTWEVGYNNTIKTSVFNPKAKYAINITFYTNLGDLPVSIPPVSSSSGGCTSTYYPTLFLSDGYEVGYPQLESNGTVFAYQLAGTQSYFNTGATYPDNNLVYSGLTLCAGQTGFLIDQPVLEPLGALAYNYDWNITYAGTTQNIKNSAYAIFSGQSGSNPFSLSDLCSIRPYNSTFNSFAIYSPELSSGSLTAGDTQLVFFDEDSAGYVPIGSGCAYAPPVTTVFSETGLANGHEWTVNYDNQTNTSYSSALSFSVPSGQSYSYRIPEVFISEAGNCHHFGGGQITYIYDVPSPSSGSAQAGTSPVNVRFTEQSSTSAC